MAKMLRNEQLKMSIVLDGNQAQNEILQLEKKNIKLKQTLKELNAERREQQKGITKIERESKKYLNTIDRLQKKGYNLSAQMTAEQVKLKTLKDTYGESSREVARQEKAIFRLSTRMRGIGAEIKKVNSDYNNHILTNKETQIVMLFTKK